MKDYTWYTYETHFDNTETMSDFINNELPEFPLEYSVEELSGNYAEISISSGKFSLQASGDGDSNNHRVSFERI